MLHTDHDIIGDTGKYFFFSQEEFNKMVGNENWNGKEIEIVQVGSTSWKGKVKVWGFTTIPHGRKSNGAADGDWATSDTITLQGCSKQGNLY